MRRILSVLLLALVILGLAVPVSAETNTNLVLRLEDDNVPLPGAVFELYLVGQADDAGTLRLTGEFADYPVDLKNLKEDTSVQAGTLHALAKKDGLTPDLTAVTGANGVAVVRGLAKGVYLLAGLPVNHGGYVYHTEAQLIVLPWKDPITGETATQPVLDVKFSKEPVTEQKVSRKVLKIWDDHSGLLRPKSVVVHLLKNGSTFGTVTLTAENQWRYTWEDLDADALWQIAEEVPDGYTVTVEQEGTTFLLTNSAPESKPPETTAPSGSSDGKIPQTGMIWWPVALLAGLGLAFIAVGMILRKESDHEA